MLISRFKISKIVVLQFQLQHDVHSELPTSAQNQHVKKAKLLAEHRDFLRSNSQESVTNNPPLPPLRPIIGKCIFGTAPLFYVYFNL